MSTAPAERRDGDDYDDCFAAFVVLIVAGETDPWIWDGVFARCRTRAAAHIRSLLPWVGDDAEDILQIACHSAIRAIRKGTVVKCARAWFLEALTNAGWSHCRRRGRDRMVRPMSDFVVEEGGVPEPAAPPPAEFEHDAIERLCAAVQDLPEKPRRVVELRLEGVAYREIALELGCTPESARTLHHRAILRLRELLGGNDDA